MSASVAEKYLFADSLMIICGIRMKRVDDVFSKYLYPDFIAYFYIKFTIIYICDNSCDWLVSKKA